MSLEEQVIIALALDLIIGDPRWSLHPVRLIGRLAQRGESWARGNFHDPQTAGIVTVIITLTVTGSACAGVIKLAELAGEGFGVAVSIILMYTTFSAKDLAVHAISAMRALEQGDIPTARVRAGMMVGRDTGQLDERGVARAVVESVAENSADGVVAPLFYAIIAGPVGAMLYKAVNTMDSAFGYTNQRYINFGKAPARLDDVANYIPARITALVAGVGAWLIRMDALGAARTLLRDGRKHASPNAGLCEAVFAGALGVRLGGLNHYQGRPRESAIIGQGGNGELCAETIRRAVRLMWVTLLLCAVALVLASAEMSGIMAIF